MMNSVSSPPKNRIRLKDVAKAANLSVSGVSLALKEHPSISQQTIDRVRSIAHELGYHPDPVMSALVAHRKRGYVRQSSRVIAMISLHESAQSEAQLAINKKICDAASKRAESLGYKLEYFSNEGEFGNLNRLEQILKSRGIRSIILLANTANHQSIQLDWGHYFLSSIGLVSHTQGIMYCDRHWIEDFSKATRYLSQMGATRIGYLVHSENDDQNHYLEHSLSKLKRLIPDHHFLNIDDDPLYDNNLHQIHKWVRANSWDGVIGIGGHFNEMVQSYNECYEQHLQYVCMDVDIETQQCAGIKPRYELLGQTAVDQVHNRFLENNKGIDQMSVATLIDGEWNDLSVPNHTSQVEELIAM